MWVAGVSLFLYPPPHHSPNEATEVVCYAASILKIGVFQSGLFFSQVCTVHVATAI